MQGEITYDAQGRPRCEICGQHFHRVLAHAWQVHKITARDYKLRFQLELSKGICSLRSSEKTRQKTLAQYDLVITRNLIKGGRHSRFKKGSPGRSGWIKTQSEPPSQ